MQANRRKGITGREQAASCRWFKRQDKLLIQLLSFMKRSSREIATLNKEGRAIVNSGLHKHPNPDSASIDDKTDRELEQIRSQVCKQQTG